MGVIERYADRLPVGPDTPRITLGEGAHRSSTARLGEKLGVELYFKFEGMNPTGSFKDRGMCVAVAKAVEDGYEGIVCASTGNTAASAAAYGARAGLTAVVLTPAGAIAAAKRRSRAPSARGSLEMNGSFDEALRVCLELAEQGVLMLVNSLNPHRIEGQKTAAFEIVEELGRAPDVLALPYGGGGNSVAYAKGFAEEDAATRLVSVQAASARRRSRPRSGSPSPRTSTRSTSSSPTPHRDRHGRRLRDHLRVARDREPRRPVLRALVGRRLRGARPRRAGARQHRRLPCSPATG